MLQGGDTPTELNTTDRKILNHSAAASLLSTENRNRYSPYNTVLISQNRTKDKVHKLNNSQHNIPLAGPFKHVMCSFTSPIDDAHPVHCKLFGLIILAIIDRSMNYKHRCKYFPQLYYYKNYSTLSTL
jgi:hypothetical protein